MKVLAVLVLAVFTGCHANFFYADAPKPQLEVLTDAFWDYVAKATQTADDTLQMIRKSQFGQDVSARLTDSADLASTYAVTLQEQLPTGAQDIITKVTSEAEMLRERLSLELTTVRGQLEPYTEDMKAKIQQSVEQMKQELSQYTDSMEPEALKTTLIQKSDELKVNLDQSIKDLQSQLVPYTDDLKTKMDQHLQDFKQNITPMTEKLQAELTQRAQQVRDLVAPYAEDLRGKLDPYAQDLQTRLTTLYQSFVNANHHAHTIQELRPRGRRRQDCVQTTHHPPLPPPLPSPSTHTHPRPVYKSAHRESVSTQEDQTLSGVSVCPSTMKSVSLILVLAIIAGCNARAVLQADTVSAGWEVAVDRFWHHVADLNKKADAIVRDVSGSQLSRELDTLITDTMAELTVYRQDIQARLGPYSTTGVLTEDLQLLANRLQKDMLDAKDRSLEYLGELKSMVEQNSEDVHSSINTYSHKLKKRLNKDTEEIRNTVTTYLGELQSRTFQNMDAAKGSVEPYVKQASEAASKKFTDISETLKTQAEGLGQQLETQAEGLRAQLAVATEDLRTTLEGKLDELTGMVSPFADQIQVQFQDILEKIKETAS
ncbi:uncharacterized protein LOC143002479 [Genypterus blacodes]|uniref:uncharacterized protein LOC143002479 n=1 Tax=Genypterus blacodes TaxID=154954 RepID=UPI003F75750E